MTIDLTEFYAFLILLLRASFIIFFSPVVGSRTVPTPAKIALSVFLAVAAMPYRGQVEIPEGVGLLVLVVLRELIFGAAVGFVARLVFEGIQLGGQYVGYMMGMAIVNVMDPQAETAVPLISHFENIVATLVFLSIGGHLWFMSAFLDSLKVVPLGALSIGKTWTVFAAEVGARIFIIAIKINAPIFVVLFLIQLVMAVVARVVPQMNIFMVGFPVQIFVGFFILAFSLRGMIWLFGKEFTIMRGHMYDIIKLFVR